MIDFLGFSIHAGDKVVYAERGRRIDCMPILNIGYIAKVTNKLVILESGRRLKPHMVVLIKKEAQQLEERIEELERELEFMRDISQRSVEAKCRALALLKMKISDCMEAKHDVTEG